MPLLLCQIAKREEKRQEEIERLRAENEQEARHLQAAVEAAARQRLMHQENAIQRRREMDAVLAQQLKEKQKRRMEEAALERCDPGSRSLLAFLIPSAR